MTTTQAKPKSIHPSIPFFSDDGEMASRILAGGDFGDRIAPGGVFIFGFFLGGGGVFWGKGKGEGFVTRLDSSHLSRVGVLGMR